MNFADPGPTPLAHAVLPGSRPRGPAPGASTSARACGARPCSSSRTGGRCVALGSPRISRLVREYLLSPERWWRDCGERGAPRGPRRSEILGPLCILKAFLQNSPRSGYIRGMRSEVRVLRGTRPRTACEHTHTPSPGHSSSRRPHSFARLAGLSPVHPRNPTSPRCQHLLLCLSVCLSVCHRLSPSLGVFMSLFS